MWKTKIEQLRPARLRAALVGEVARIRGNYVRGIGWFVGIASLLACIQLVGTALARIRYPYALEWMEPGMVDHVRVVLSGKPLYRQPSLEWTPYIYTPFYYWVSAIFVKVLGVGMFPLRLVSLLSILAILNLIAAFVHREVGGVLGPLVAAGLFAVTYRVTGFWLDLARVDALFVALLLGGAYLGRFAENPRAAGASGALLFLAFFTKQSALAVAVPVLVAMIAMNWRRGLVATGVFAALMIGALQWMDLSSNHWFRYYVFEVASKHPYPPFDQWRELFERATWKPMVFGLVLAGVALFSGVLREKPSGRAVLFFYLGILGGAWFHGFSGIIHDGGFENALIPYCATLAILSGIAIGWIMRERPDVRRLQAFGLVVVLLQFANLGFDQRVVLPRKRDWRAGLLVEERLREIKGEVLSPGFGYFTYLAGHEEIHAPSMALADVFKTQDPDLTGPLAKDMVTSVESGRFKAIIWDDSYRFLPETFKEAIRRRYMPKPGLIDDPAAFWPKTGMGARPNEVYSRN
jgi:hypothetical protein